MWWYIENVHQTVQISEEKQPRAGEESYLTLLPVTIVAQDDLVQFWITVFDKPIAYAAVMVFKSFTGRSDFSWELICKNTKSLFPGIASAPFLHLFFQVKIEVGT